MHVFGSGAWQAEPFSSAPAKHAAAARDRNGVRDVGRDRNHPLTLEGHHAHWSMLTRYVAVPEPSSPSVAPSEELARCCHSTAGIIPSCHNAHPVVIIKASILRGKQGP